MIDKIKCNKKIGTDIHNYLIAVLSKLSEGWIPPEEITRDLPLDKIKKYVIYCDIPYRGTTKYATDSFPYEEFYEWVKKASVNNIVLISEYSMPDEFECIWSKETKTLLDSNKDIGDEKNIRVEKLFTYKG